MNIIIFFIILLVLVLVHEAGHFFTAKKFGIRVDEFGFGFPPKLFGIKKGETEYTFNLLPIGGFVKIFGENPEEPLPSPLLDKERVPKAGEVNFERSFQNKPAWQQVLVLSAGVFANFLLAWMLFSFGFISGLPTSVSSDIGNTKLTDVHLVVVSVTLESPAELAGLKSGDKITLVQKNNLSTRFISPETIRSMIRDGGEIEIGYTRGQNPTENLIKITPKGDTQSGYLIGIAMDQIGIAKLPVFASFVEGAKLTAFVTQNTAVGLYTLIIDGLRGQGSLDSVAGPVGMVGIVGDAYQFGFVYLLSFAALISVNLGIINLLPFPALDGGRIFFILIEKIKGSKMNPLVANTANTVGFAILIILMLFVTYHDVVKLF